jgi:hypothetical protein
MAADRQQDLRMAEGLERLLLAQGLPAGPRLKTQAYACVLICDSLLKEAFRNDPHGDADLLEETKEILRAYLVHIVGTL